jgi:hypothetical protein
VCNEEQLSIIFNTMNMPRKVNKEEEKAKFGIYMQRQIDWLLVDHN